MVGLSRAMTGLSILHRQTLLLVGVEGMTYAEAAGVLEVPVGTVMSRLSRARGSASAYRRRLSSVDDPEDQVMGDDRVSDSELNALVDDELDPARHAEVEAWLADNPEAAQRGIGPKVRGCMPCMTIF